MLVVLQAHTSAFPDQTAAITHMRVESVAHVVGQPCSHKPLYAILCADASATFMGCYNDYHVTPKDSAPSSGLSWTWVSWPMRDLPSVSILSDNSIASCGKMASSQGSVLFGMSKSLECWWVVFTYAIRNVDFS